MLLPRRCKIVFVGDAITESCRQYPVGEGPGEALGRGYVSMVAAIAGAFLPEHPIRWVNMGHAGATVRSLRKRWHADVLDVSPDWIAIMIGATDAIKAFDSPLQTESHVCVQEYELILDAILTEAAGNVRGMILLAPAAIEPNVMEPLRVQLDIFGGVNAKLATKFGATFVDTQAAFDKALKFYHPSVLATDRIHPTPLGHMVIARAILDAIRFPWPQSPAAVAPATPGRKSEKLPGPATG